MTTSQTKDRARDATDGHDGRRTASAEQPADRAEEDLGVDTRGVAAVAALTEQAGAAGVEASRQAQDAILALVRQGQDGVVMMARMWTETLRRPGPSALAPTRAAIGGGYDLIDQLLARQRRFVDRLLAEQRRFAEALLTPPRALNRGC